MQSSNKIPVSNNLIINNHNLNRRASMNSKSLASSITNLDINNQSSLIEPTSEKQTKQFNQSLNYRSRSNITNTKGSFYKFRNRIKSLDMGCYEPVRSTRSNSICPSIPIYKMTHSATIVDENTTSAESSHKLRRNSSTNNLCNLKKYSSNSLNESLEEKTDESIFSEKNVSSMIDKVRENFFKSKSIINELPNLLSKDSFKYLRFGLSVFILIISVLFLLLTLFQDSNIYDNAFRFIYNNIEIKNPTKYPRAIWTVKISVIPYSWKFF